MDIYINQLHDIGIFDRYQPPTKLFLSSYNYLK
jgi:hypothetical protein